MQQSRVRCYGKARQTRVLNGMKAKDDRGSAHLQERTKAHKDEVAHAGKSQEAEGGGVTIATTRAKWWRTDREVWS